MKKLIFLCMCLFSIQVTAEVYKCVVDGNTVYQRYKCQDEDSQKVIKERAKFRPLPKLTFEQAANGYPEFVEVFADKTNDCKIELKVYGSAKKGCVGVLGMLPEYRQRTSAFTENKDVLTKWIAKNQKIAVQTLGDMEKAKSNMRYIDNYQGIK